MNRVVAKCLVVGGVALAMVAPIAAHSVGCENMKEALVDCPTQMLVNCPGGATGAACTNKTQKTPHNNNWGAKASPGKRRVVHFGNGDHCYDECDCFNDPNQGLACLPDLATCTGKSYTLLFTNLDCVD